MIFWAISLRRHSSTVLLTKICPKFQVISFHFSRLMSCLMSIGQKLCKVKIFQLQSMLNAIRGINQRFAFKNSRISCLARLALIFKLKNPSMTVLYAKKTVAGGEIWQAWAWGSTDIHIECSADACLFHHCSCRGILGKLHYYAIQNLCQAEFKPSDFNCRKFKRPLKWFMTTLPFLQGNHFLSVVQVTAGFNRVWQFCLFLLCYMVHVQKA